MPTEQVCEGSADVDAVPGYAGHPGRRPRDIPSYCGPKEIGQIFGISYIYSMFFRFGLIRVPKRVAGKLLNGSDKSPAPIAQEQ